MPSEDPPIPTPPAPTDPPAITPEYVKELRDENATRRNEAKRLRDENATLARQLADAVKAVPPAPVVKSQDDLAAQLSETRATLREVSERAKRLEDDANTTKASAAKRMLRASLTHVLTKANISDIETAVIVLESRGARLTDDDKIMIDTLDADGESQTVLLTGETLKKYGILKDHFFPPAGVPGSGSSAPRQAPAGVDLKRAQDDFAHFEKNEKQILEHLRAESRR